MFEGFAMHYRMLSNRGSHFKGPGKQGHIVAATNVSPFARVRNICCRHKFWVRNTKNVSQFVHPRNIMGNNVSSFTRALKFSNVRDPFALACLKIIKHGDSVGDQRIMGLMCYIYFFQEGTVTNPAIWGAFHSTKYSGLKFRVFHATNGTVYYSSLD